MLFLYTPGGKGFLEGDKLWKLLILKLKVVVRLVRGLPDLQDVQDCYLQLFMEISNPLFL
jgi:hypothetical protein